jgi:hypothetical protein
LPAGKVRSSVLSAALAVPANAAKQTAAANRFSLTPTVIFLSSVLFMVIFGY